MELVTLGNTGIIVSRICFGTLALGPLQANFSLSDGARVLAHAVNRGINFCDTAQLYGTYPYIREAMRQSGKTDLVIATKTYAHTRALASEAFEQARRELDRDYIDIFLLHEQESAHTLRGHAEALEFLLEQKQRGSIRAVGASMHHVAAVEGATERGLDVIHPLINKNGLGIADGGRGDMERAAQKARERGIGVYTMKALGGGNLFREAESCLRYAFGLGFADSVAIGMQSECEVDANIEILNNGAFSPEARKILEEKNRRLHIDSWCDGCGACAARCGQRALLVENGAASCDHARCVLCGYCSTVCPQWAIKIV